MIEVIGNGVYVTLKKTDANYHFPIGTVRFERVGDFFTFYEVAKEAHVPIFKDVKFDKITVPSAANANALELLLLPIVFFGVATPPTEPTSPITSQALLERANWNTIAGNVTTITKYTGVEAGNPSGNVANIKTIVFSNGEGTVFTNTFAYDAANDVINITTS